MSTFKCTLFILFLVSANAFARPLTMGPGVNNGGGGWQCVTADGRVKWVQTHDLWMQRSQSSHLRAYAGRSAAEIYASLRAEIKNSLPELDLYMNRHPVDFKQAVILSEGPFEVIHDSLISAKPAPQECPQGRIYYVQIADFLKIGKLLIDSNIWGSPAFSEIDKAGLLLHEAIYFALREEFGEETSLRTSELVGLIFSKKSVEDLQEDFYQIIWVHRPPLRRGESVALFPVDLMCEASIQGWREQKAVPWGSSVGFKSGDISFGVRSAESDGVPQDLNIFDAKTGASTSGSSFVRSAFTADHEVEITMSLRDRGIFARLRCWTE